jgi:MFS family permease
VLTWELGIVHFYRISDRVGRRPILLLGLIGNTVTMLLFGVSHSLWWCIMARSLCGILNGNVGVAKSMIGEITDSTNEASGFSIVG